MSKKDISIALVAIVSYALSKAVRYVRLVYCDAIAYDKGCVDVNELLDTVEVQGEGGTIIQSAIILLENNDDFSKNAPLLIVTDGCIENHISIHREHAFLLRYGKKLPFFSKKCFFYRDDV